MFGVIVRSTRERTEKLCIKSVGRETDDIAVLRNACPFAEAVRTMMKVAEIRKWDKYLAIDADVVLIRGWHKIIKERMDKVENFYKMIFLVVDRFIPENIYRGIHLYNSTFHGNIIMALSHTYYTSKPEGNMRHIISNPQIACKDILGYHGFEQWHKDIFNRFALRAIRNPEYIKKYKIFDGKLDLEHKIKDLKRQLKELNTPEPEKEKLIAEILKLEPNFPKDLVDLRKYTNEQLQKHIDIVKRKRGIK